MCALMLFLYFIIVIDVNIFEQKIPIKESGI